MVYTYMADAAALAKGADVNLNGIPVGKVNEHRAVRLQGSTAAGSHRHWSFRKTS